MSSFDITPKMPAGRQLIQSYGRGGFKVGGEPHPGSVLVFPERTLPWPVRNAADITVDSLVEVTRASRKTSLLLIGCGSRFLPFPHGLGKDLRDLGVALEWMDTGAACRTFNVLLIEDRAVAAALIAVD